MTVGQLKEILEDLPEDANVLIVDQESWPWEYTVNNVTQRSELGDDGDGFDHETPAMQPTDVLITTGKQIRMGSRDAWR